MGEAYLAVKNKYILKYDFFLSFRWGNHTFTGHNSPLYSRPDETSESSPGYQLSTDFAIKYWLSLGTVVKSFLLISKLHFFCLLRIFRISEVAKFFK